MNAPALHSPDLCYRAAMARDLRFDGRFFLAVKTTGIFCRPVCPAPKPRRENVEFFPSAAAALKAGYRPCLRCRPEAAPESTGGSATVARALRRIQEGVLEDGGVAGLAAELGLGPRQLRRLFVQHVGAPPRAVAHTLRVQFAKKLLDETDLSIAEVAFAAGYSSVRRFNAAFREAWHRAPRDLRRAARAGTPAGAKETAIQLHLGTRLPFDWSRLVGFLAPRATPGVERVEDGVYRRTFAGAGRKGVLEVLANRDAGQLLLRLYGAESADLLALVRRVRRLFDLDADPESFGAQLGTDSRLGPLLRRRPGLRVPGAFDPFELTVRAILGQQVTVKGATTLAGRLVECCGERLSLDPPWAGLDRLFPTPAALANADLSELGVPGSRRRTLRELAGAVERGDLNLGGPPEEARRVLRGIAGIGEWTVQYVAMRALGDPDAFPAGDLGLQRALARASESADPKADARLTAGDLERLAEAWRPWRSYAALYWWDSLAAEEERDG